LTRKGLNMSTVTVSATPNIEWDDSVVFVFSFTGPGGPGFVCGFVHAQPTVAIAAGSSVQINNIIQQTQQKQVQATLDSQSWVDTVKNAVRNNKSITITFDDAVNTVYTTQTNQSFTLQQLFSVVG